MHGIHSNASCHSTIMAVRRGPSRPALRLQFCKCLRRATEITTRQLVIYSADANARSYRISKDLLWLERRCPRGYCQIQFALHRKGHHSKPGLSLGNGNQKWAATFAVCRDQWPHACRRQRRRSRTLSRREQTRRSERCCDRRSDQRAMRERATRGRGKTQLVDVVRRFLETSPRLPRRTLCNSHFVQRAIWSSFAQRHVRLDLGLFSSQ